MRNPKGLSTVETLIALTILASLGVLTGPVLQAMEDRQKAISRQQFAMFVDRFVSTATARIKNDTPFSPTALNLTNAPLAPGSRYTGSATFQGCLTGGAVTSAANVSQNNLSESEMGLMKRAAMLRTPAYAIAIGAGQTGGVVLNETFDRQISAQPAVFVYFLSGPEGKQFTAQLLGEEVQCP